MSNIVWWKRLVKASDAGYSLIEMMMTVGILGVVSTMAIAQIGQARPGLSGDGAMRVVMAQVSEAREKAITKRRNMRLVFTADNQVQILEENVPGPSTTAYRSVALEGGIGFSLIAGLRDTPKGFGNDYPVLFRTASSPRQALEVKFTPDGHLVNEDGATINGTIFLAKPKLARSARAVTVMGSTGQIRCYKWDGKQWTQS
jgi:prepilin-type N-terminal cleavage/methylation domain-containing protein